MRKLNLILGLFIIMALMLTACDGLTVDETTDGTDTVFQETDDAFLDETPMETAIDVEETEIPVVEETPMVDETPMADETLVVPTTGMDDRYRISFLLDFDVIGENGEEIGNIDGFVLDIDNQQIQYALIEVGGFLGIGAKQVAIPYDRLRLADDMENMDDFQATEEVDTEETDMTETPEADMVETEEVQDNDAISTDDDREMVFYLDVTEEELENAPEFDQDAFAGLGEPLVEDWDVEYQNFWEGDMTATDDEDEIETPEVVMEETPEVDVTEEAQTEGEGMAMEELHGVMLATEVMDIEIQDQENVGLATVDDIIVDPHSGEIRYLLLNVTAIEAFDRDSMFITFGAVAMQYDTENKVLVVDDQQILIDNAVNEDEVSTNLTGMIPDTGAEGMNRETLEDLMDYEVIDVNDESIGTINNFVLDMNTNQILYALVDVGGFLGLGATEVAIPYDRLELSSDMATQTDDDEAFTEEDREAVFYLNIVEEDLVNAPEFDNDAFPELGDPENETWNDEIENYWANITTGINDDVQAEADDIQTQNGMGLSFVRANDLLEMDVYDGSDEQLANIDGVIVDRQSGDILYIVFSNFDITDLENRTIFIPVESISWSHSSEDDGLVLNIDRQVLVDAPFIDAGTDYNSDENLNIGVYEETDSYWATTTQ